VAIRKNLSTWLRKQALPVLFTLPVAICFTILAGTLYTVGPAV